MARYEEVICRVGSGALPKQFSENRDKGELMILE
jgi:hypothetical protein